MRVLTGVTTSGVVAGGGVDMIALMQRGREGREGRGDCQERATSATSEIYVSEADLLADYVSAPRFLVHLISGVKGGIGPGGSIRCLLEQPTSLELLHPSLPNTTMASKT
jgi:hypothetical protein